jgi:hypothetical protein
MDRLAGGGALHEAAEAVAEFVGADLSLGARWGMELAGLEPATSSLPARRYFQLSYSPKLVVGGPVYRGLLSVSGVSDPEKCSN